MSRHVLPARRATLELAHHSRLPTPDVQLRRRDTPHAGRCVQMGRSESRSFQPGDKLAVHRQTVYGFRSTGNAQTMPAILKTAVDDAGFDAFRSALDAAHPRLRFGRERVDGRKVTLRAQYGGMRVFWVYGGEGEAYLPEGYRTKEGDGQRLPSSYAPEHADRSFLETLAYIEAHLTALPDPVRGVAQAVIGRRRDSSYIGDFANELWKLAHIPKPWTTDDSATRALESLFLNYEDHGYSVKTESSWERIISGDQLIVGRRRGTPGSGAILLFRAGSARAFPAPYPIRDAASLSQRQFRRMQFRL